MDQQKLTALLQLTSPTLPIGGFSYSQAFEAAVEHKIITNEASSLEWISDQLQIVMAQCEAPIWLLLFDAWFNKNHKQALHWNLWFLASRESREARLETEQMGWSLAKLASDLKWGEENTHVQLSSAPSITLPYAHAFCAQALEMDKHSGLTAYLFTWLENQVMAAIKAVPLGQVAGQRILNNARQLIPDVVLQATDRAVATPPKLATLAPQFSILSSRHETQYSRLFRS